MSKNKTVLVFRTGHLGDTICAIPAFRLLRQHFSNDQLVLLCDHPRNGSKVAATEVSKSLGVFDQIRAYRSGNGVRTALDLFWQICSIRPDVLVFLPQVREEKASLLRKKKFFQWCGVSEIRGAEVGHDLFLESQQWQINEPSRLVELLNLAGIIGNKPSYEIPIDEIARKTVIEQLREIGIDPTQPYLAFCGGGTVPTQLWPASHYATLLQELFRELRWPIVAIGTPKEITRYKTNIAPIFPELRYLNAPLSIMGLIELCRMAAAYLGNDTGPMHVAAAVGCPTIVIMSARNAPGMWDPDVEPRLVIRHRTECENCFLETCVTENHRCMTAITVKRVLSESLPFLKSLRSNST